MKASETKPEVLPSNSPPPRSSIVVLPNSANVSLSSGQSEVIHFTVAQVNIDNPVAVSLSVDSPPPGVTAVLSPSTLQPTEYQFSLTLTAALDVSPRQATIVVRATAPDINSRFASVSINAQSSGQLSPSYQLLTIVYAPPGTNSGKGTSQVVYGSDSTTGAVNSISDSFKEGVDISASLSIPIGNVVKLGLGGEFTASRTATATSQISISKSTAYQISVPGPAHDGIDHSRDLYYLWLNPVLNASIDAVGNLVWDVAVNGPTMLIQYVYGLWLQDPSQMPAGVTQALHQAGLTEADYAQILKCNPFSSGDSAIDPKRFISTAFSFPYIPPPSASDPVPTMTYTQTSKITVTDTEESQTQYSVDVDVSVGFQVLGALKVGGSLQWTDTRTSSQSNEVSQSATVTIGGPAFGYEGPTDVLVYWDTIFNSFMFAFATEAASASGTLLNSAGEPRTFQPLTLSVGGVTLRTFTDANGEYRFYGDIKGTGSIAVGNQSFPVNVGPGESAAKLQVIS